MCECATESQDPKDRLGLAVERVRVAAGCEKCRGTGYQGRFLIAEFLIPEAHGVGRSILERSDSIELERRAATAGMKSRWHRAAEAVNAGITSPVEIRRVLGFSSE